MPREAPFDAWDGEGLESTDDGGPDTAEEAALHLDPDSALDERPASWSDLTGVDVTESRGNPVSYFSDEEPEVADPRRGGGERERELDLDEYLHRQHYSFPSAPNGRG